MAEFEDSSVPVPFPPSPYYDFLIGPITEVDQEHWHWYINNLTTFAKESHHTINTGPYGDQPHSDKHQEKIQCLVQRWHSGLRYADRKAFDRLNAFLYVEDLQDRNTDLQKELEEKNEEAEAELAAKEAEMAAKAAEIAQLKAELAASQDRCQKVERALANLDIMEQVNLENQVATAGVSGGGKRQV